MTGQDVLRWTALAVYFLMPLMVLALIGLVAYYIRDQRQRDAEQAVRDGQKLDLIAQQGRALNWLVDEAKGKVARVEAKVDRVEGKVDEHRAEVQQATSDIKHTITESRQALGGGES